MDTVMKIHIWICLFVAALLASSDMNAEYFSFRHYEVENGLPSNTVRTLLQDSRGFIWCGTEGGLSRFDGIVFKNYLTIAGDSSSLGNNYIYALFEDSRQIFWTGTDEGIYLYKYETETFEPFNKTTADGITVQGHITAIDEDSKHNIWIATMTQGVFRYDIEKDTLINYTHQTGDPESLVSNIILHLYIDNRDAVWVAPQSNYGIINCFNRETGKFTPLQLKLKDAGQFDIYAITEDHAGKLWAGTWSHGLCRIDRNTGNIEQFLTPDSHNGISHIHAITEYQPGILLVGSDDGLAIFNTSTCKSEMMTQTELKTGTLSDNFIYPIVKDSEGGLWIGTYYGGVNYAPPQKGSIEGYSYSKYSNSVGGNIISCFAEDKEGNIWTGSDDGGLSCFNPKNKTFVNYMPDDNTNSLSYHNIHALCFDGDLLWIGTYSGGLNVLNLKTGRFKQYWASSTDSTTIDVNSIYSIYNDNGEIWIGTMKGICRYNRDKDNFTRMLKTNITILDIVADESDNIWFATWGMGLYRYDKAAKRWTHYTHNKNHRKSIPHNQVNTLHVDANNNLYLGTVNGIARYNRKNNTFDDLDPVFANSHVCCIKNINNELWISTANGLVTYNLNDGSIKRLSKSDGLMSDQFNYKSGIISSCGYLYLGTTNGFNIIKPEEISDNKYIPPVYITNIQVANKDIQIKDKGLLTRSALFIDKIELSYRDNVISIEYAALSYSAPTKNRYKYKLEGFDSEWNDVGSQRKATYTNLPAGKYVFHVTGSNNDGLMNPESRDLVIIIHPPFWRTTIAYILYIAAVIGIMALIMRYLRLRTEKKHKERMLQLQTEKDRALNEAKINFFTFVAHEIRTPVSLIITPLEKIMNEIHSVPQNLHDSINIINRNSQRLLALVNQLLDFRKAEENAFIIHFAKHNVYDLLNSLYVRFIHQAEQKNINLSLKCDDRNMTAVVDAEALTKIVSNLLTNAIKYAKSKITLSCKSENGYIFIVVTDDGDGIDPDDQKRIFLPFYQADKNSQPGSGIGLSLVKMLVDAHKGMVEVDCEPDSHTSFKVMIPEIQPTVPEETPAPTGSDMSAIESVDETLKPSLLIIDDDPDMRNLLVDGMKESYNLIEATNGKEGLEKLQSNDISLIISDIMMPEIDGLEFTRLVKENIEYSHIPLILLTARTDNDTKLESIQTGADAYIEKPFSMNMLYALINNLLKSRQSLRRKFSEMPFAPLSSVTENNADKILLENLHNLISTNLTNPNFNVGVLAEQLGISRSGLFRKIKTLAGMSPNELIQLMRLKKGAEMILQGDYRVNEIYYRVGFNNISYFTKCFRLQFGMSPKDFAKKHGFQ